MNLESGKKNDNLNYTHFSVYKETGLINNGWSYPEKNYSAEDLRSDKQYFFGQDLEDMGCNPKDYKILSKQTLLRSGIDPSDMNNWSKDSIGMERCHTPETQGEITPIHEKTEEELKYGQNPNVAYAGHTGKHGTFDNGYKGYFISDPNGGTLYPRNKKEAIAMIKVLYPDPEDTKYVISQLTQQGMNESMDQWEDAVYRHEVMKKLPKGWDKHERENDEPVYTDQDYNEYVKDEYGKFVPYINEETETSVDDKNFVFHTRTGSFVVNVAEEIEYDENTACLNCYINRTVPATIYVEKSAYNQMKDGGQYCDCVCKIARNIKDNGEEIEGTLSRMNMNESLGFNEQADVNENDNEMWNAVIEHGMGSEIEDMVYEFCEKHDMGNIGNLITDEVKDSVFQVFQKHIQTMRFLNRGWEFR